MKRIEILVIVITFLAGAAISAGSAAAQSCVDPPDGLISWWTGDGTTDDSHSNLHATAIGGAHFAPGLVGQAFRFNGAGEGQDDRVDLPAEALQGLEDLTVEFWLHTTDQDEGAILSGGNVAGLGANELLLLFRPEEPAGLATYVRDMTPGKPPAILNDGLWHHVAFAREGDIGRLYVDGALVDAMTYPAGPLDVGVGGLMLGQDQDCLGGCFDPDQALDGLIDELAIYGRALSDDEVWAIADAGGDGKCKPALAPSNDELTVRIEEIELYSDGLESRVAELESHVDALESDFTLLLERMSAFEEQEYLCDGKRRKSSCKAKRHGKNSRKCNQC
jgi:hypothetical protein